MLKVIAGFLLFVSVWFMAGCRRINEASLETQSTEETFPEIRYMEKISFAAGPWQNAYAAFLRGPENYTERDHYAGNFALADLDNDGSPELIIAYYDGVQGGAIFANVYLYNGKVRMIGQQSDMYYKGCYYSTDPSFPGVFVEGGRMSNFSCSHWTIKNSMFVDEPLWSNAYDYDVGEMVYEEFTGNKQLIAEAKRVISLYPYGIEFSEIDEINIQKAIYDN
ncbi:MAG: hypothetical protein LBB75_02345 [Oscillospiraceae bacterium]|jgi:hypothetical protein|nr:hypothetical protein [Oscillospiraceae bacterium]